MALPGHGFAPGRHVVEAYGRGGFRFAGISHVGSVLMLPAGVHAWAATGPEDITVASLAPVLAEAAGIELLFIGMGASVGLIAPDVRAVLAESGIRFEPMPTAAAARTYNVLVQEDRRVAAALIAVD